MGGYFNVEAGLTLVEIERPDGFPKQTDSVFVRSDWLTNLRVLPAIDSPGAAPDP